MKRNLFTAFFLCFASFVLDFFYFRQENMDLIVAFMQHQSVLGGLLRLAAHWAIALSVSVSFLFLWGCVPYAGFFLQIAVWLFSTLPYRLYYSVMGVAPNSEDLWSLWTTPAGLGRETIFALLSPGSVLESCVPVLLALLLLLLIDKKYLKPRIQTPRKRPGIRRALAVLSALLLFSFYSLHPISGNVFFGESIFNSRRVVFSFLRESELYRIPRDAVASGPETPPEDNILLIIDESVRPDYLSAVNESAGETTPRLSRYLSEFDENAFNYGIMLAGGTYSLLGRSIILTGISRLPDEDFSSQRNPTLFQLARARGYKTALADLQEAFPYVVFRESDMECVDEAHLKWRDFSSDPQKADIAAATWARKRMSEEKGLFIVLLKWGVHVHYEARYPGSLPEHRHFLPKLEAGERHSPEKRREIVNSYKNALRYNVDGFFSALLGEDPRSLEDTTILWTSDHGQSLQEDGQLEPHGSRYLEQALTPFMLFSTNRWVLEHLKRPKDIAFTLSHMNIYPTVRSIMEKKTDIVSGEYASLFYTREAAPPPLRYMYGSLWDGPVASPDAPNGKLELREEKYLY